MQYSQGVSSYPAGTRVIRAGQAPTAGYAGGVAQPAATYAAAPAQGQTYTTYPGGAGVPAGYSQAPVVRTVQSQYSGAGQQLPASRVVQAGTTGAVYSSQPGQPTVIRSVQAAPTSAVYSSQPVVRPSPVQQGAPMVTRVVPSNQQASVVTASNVEAKMEDAQLNNLKELRQTSGLKFVPVNQSLPVFKGSAVDGKLSREQFLVAYQNLLTQYGVEVPPATVLNAVFDLFDRDQNGIVDMMELICGISLFCSGSEDEKILAVFNVFDENGDGYISMDEMFKFLTSVFKVVLTPNVMQVMMSMGVTVESAEDLASVTALECFKAADLNHDGKLSIDEFKTWFYAPKNDPSFIFSPMQQLFQ